MRTALLLLSMGLVASAAAAPSDKDASATSNPSRSKGASPANASVIPAGAQQINENVWTYTGSDGKKWFYRKTPFGVVKTDIDVTAEQTSEQPSRGNPFAGSQPHSGAQQVSKPKVKIVDLGDAYSFERATPFGPSKWVRKKSELNDDEKALLESTKTEHSDESHK